MVNVVGIYSSPLLGQACVTGVAHILLTRSTTLADRRGRLREQDMIPTNTCKVFAAGLLIASLSIEAAAAPPRTRTITDDYRARYDERRHVYCIKFFADLPAAMPQPGPSRDICKSQAAWAKEGVRVNRADDLRSHSKVPDAANAMRETGLGGAKPRDAKI